MKNVTIYFFAILSGCSFLLAEENKKTAFPLPRPPVTIQQIEAEYTPHLQSLETALKDGNAIELYKVLTEILIIERTNSKVRELRNSPSKPREDILRSELFNHYVLHAPFYPGKDIIEKTPSELGRELEKKGMRTGIAPGDLISWDITVKFSVARSILFREIAERAPILGKSADTLKREQILQLQTLIKSLREEKRKNEILYLKYRDGLEVAKKRFREEMDAFGREHLIGGSEGWSEEIKIKHRYWRAIDNCDAYRTRNKEIEKGFKGVEPELVKFLLKTYPKNGNAIRAALFKCGYTPEECYKLFSDTLGKGKEHDYLFQGLPKSPSYMNFSFPDNLFVNPAFQKQKNHNTNVHNPFPKFYLRHPRPAEWAALGTKHTETGCFVCYKHIQNCFCQRNNRSPEKR